MNRIDTRIVALVVSLYAIATPAPAWACGCTPSIDRPWLTPQAAVDEQLAWADRVFLGRVSSRTDVVVVFSIEAYWKGDGASTEAVASGVLLPNGSIAISDCDYSFENARLYVVFAHRTPKGLSVSSCSMTQSLDSAATLVARLDRAAPRRVVNPMIRAAKQPPNQRLQPTAAQWIMRPPRLNRGR